MRMVFVCLWAGCDTCAPGMDMEREESLEVCIDFVCVCVFMYVLMYAYGLLCVFGWMCHVYSLYGHGEGGEP
jgi:hypothetical protein